PSPGIEAASAGHRQGRVGQGAHMAPKAHKARNRGLAKPYEPAPHERAALEAYLVRKKRAPLAPLDDVFGTHRSRDFEPCQPNSNALCTVDRASAERLGLAANRAPD